MVNPPDDEFKLSDTLPEGVYEVYPEEQVGSIPMRTEMMVLPGDPDRLTTNFTVKVFIGPALYLFREDGTVITEPVTERGAMRPGMMVATPWVGGYFMMEVDESGTNALSESGELRAILRFGEDERKCWVVAGFINLRGLRQVSMKSKDV